MTGRPSEPYHHRSWVAPVRAPRSLVEIAQIGVTAQFANLVKPQGAKAVEEFTFAVIAIRYHIGVGCGKVRKDTLSVSARGPLFAPSKPCLRVDDKQLFVVTHCFTRPRC